MKKTKVLIVGAGVAGRELLVEINKNLASKYSVVGFIDDDPEKQGVVIDEVEVHGKISDLGKIAEELSVREVYIAIPSATGETLRRIIDECRKHRVIFRVIPRTLDIVLGKVKLQHVREVEVEDLLGRAIMQSEQAVFKDYFKGKTVLVTGAAGSIGSEICRQVSEFPIKTLVGVDWWESGIFSLERELEAVAPKGQKIELLVASVVDKLKMQDIFKRYKPDIVFHAAAYKHVYLMEKYPDEAVKNNVFGTLQLAETAYLNKVDQFINISTDKAVKPKSIMGMSKLLGECIVANLNSFGKTKYSSVRFGNVLASQGSVVPLFKKQIASGGPVTITDRHMTRYFMTIPEATQLVLHASAMGNGGEVFVLDMGEPIKIIDLAKLMINLSGFVPGKDINIKYIGRKPGEKLTEELYSAYESLETTSHSKVFKVVPGDFSKKFLLETLSELETATGNLDNSKVKSILKQFASRVNGKK